MVHLGEYIAKTFIEELQTSLVGSETANFPLSRVEVNNLRTLLGF